MLPIGDQPLPEQHFCLHLNVSQCDASENFDRFVATVYNPRSSEVTTYVRLPVTQGSYIVLDPDGIRLMPSGAVFYYLLARNRSAKISLMDGTLRRRHR